MQTTDSRIEETLTIHDIAKLLHRAPSTIATEVTKAPHKLPPRLRLPGSRKVLWLRADVDAWLRTKRDSI